MRKKIKKNTSQYFLLTLLFLLFFLLPPLSTQPVKAAEESFIISTVSVTPLKITLAARKTIFVGQRFNLKATIENLGQKDINEIILILNLPADLILEKGSLEQNLGLIKPTRRKMVNWQIRAPVAREYTIQALASGLEEETNQTITSSTSIFVKVVKKNIFGLFSWLFSGFFNSIF